MERKALRAAVLALICLSIGDAAGAAEAPLMGINLNGLGDSSRSYMFMDAMKTSRTPGSAAVPYDGGPNLVYDKDGWPLGDFGSFVISCGIEESEIGRCEAPDITGTYKLSFKGKADVSFPSSQANLQNAVYDAVSNTTRADVVVTGGTQLVLSFKNTGAGIKDVRLIRPDRFKSPQSNTFSKLFLDGIAPFQVIRFMDYLHTNDKEEFPREWASRTRADGPTQSGTNGGSYEYIIELATTTGKDIWVNVPDMATDDYILQLAKLFKAKLPSTTKIYLEYSNEVWNSQFKQWRHNYDLAISEGIYRMDATDDNAGYWAWRRTAKRTMDISNIFRSVYGDGAMMTQVRPVLTSHVANIAVVKSGLEFINLRYGPPSRFFWGISGAPYFNPTKSVDMSVATVDQIISAMQGNLRNIPNYFAEYYSIAQAYGLKNASYEGGLDTGQSTQNVPTKIAVSHDPRMKQIIHDYMARSLGCGTDFMDYFVDQGAYSHYGQWGLTNNILKDSPKLDGLRQVFAEPANSFECGAERKQSSAGALGSGTGLTGRYYGDSTFTTLVKTRPDKLINFIWGRWRTGAPTPGLSSAYSVRWTGKVQAKFSETVTFDVFGNQKATLWVNGQKIVDYNAGSTAAPSSHTGTIALTAGQQYSIQLDFAGNDSDTTLALFWSSPSQPRALVQTSQLFADASVGAGPSNQAPVVAVPSNLQVTFGNSLLLEGTAGDDRLPSGTLTTRWEKISGPGTVTLANAGAQDTLATFSAAGDYKMRLTATDGQLSASAETAVKVSLTNAAPTVEAGVAKTITSTMAVSLDATVKDDGFPAPPRKFTVAWSKVSGPGTVTFADPSASDTKASFSSAGTYVLRLTANDTLLSASDTVTISVTQGSAVNKAPVVKAGSNRTVILPLFAGLEGSVSDDKLPNPALVPTARWTKVSGPGTVSFDNDADPTTIARFSAAGTYVLRLTANDGALSASDDVTVTVYQGTTAANQAPSVSAGPDRTVASGASASLDGTVSDDGLPAAGALTTAWSKTSGPGTVTFADASAVDTTAQFSAAGTYTLKLTASDGAASSSDSMQVVVGSAAPTMSVASFTLLDAVKKSDIGPLTEGMTLDLNALGAKLSVRANTAPGTVGSVVFVYDGAPLHTENLVPYTLLGDAATSYAAWTPTPGRHTLKATPYSAANGSGTAGAALQVTFTASDVPRNAFRGLYFSRIDPVTFALDETSLALTRVDGPTAGGVPLDFDWQAGAPAEGLQATSFGARWEGDWDFTAAAYEFTAAADDGIRVWIDGALVAELDKWFPQAATTYTAYRRMSAGVHRVKVEYFQQYRNDVVKLSWRPVQAVTGLTLVNAVTKADISPLTDGSTIDLSRTGTRLSVRAAAEGGPIGSVVFTLDGAYLHTENGAPYMILGDNAAGITYWTPTAGKHTLLVTPYTGPDGTGTAGMPKSVTFTVRAGLSASLGMLVYLRTSDGGAESAPPSSQPRALLLSAQRGSRQALVFSKEVTQVAIVGLQGQTYLTATAMGDGLVLPVDGLRVPTGYSMVRMRSAAGADETIGLIRPR